MLVSRETSPPVAPRSGPETPVPPQENPKKFNAAPLTPRTLNQRVEGSNPPAPTKPPKKTVTTKEQKGRGETSARSHRETCSGEPATVPPSFGNGARLIPLTRGLFAVVDAVDYRRLAKFSWFAVPRSNGKGFYAVRSVTVRGRQRRVWMHHVVSRVRAGQKVDHRDGDGLNNRWANLRPCSTRQNNANRLLPNLSGYRGVQVTAGGLWRARLRVGGVQRHLGTFATAEAAARAYDLAAWAEHGEFARLNFPRG